MTSRRPIARMIPAVALAALLAPALLALWAPPLAAQQVFDIEAYRRYLAANASLDAPGLLAQYDAGRFLRTAGGGFSGALFADSIDRYYTLTGYEKDLIARNGFMVTERVAPPHFGAAFLDIYNRDLPVFVSTDAILHALHRSYDDILIETEQGHLIPKLRGLLDALRAGLPALEARHAAEPRLAPMLRDLDLYLTLPRILLDDDNSIQPLYPENRQVIAELLDLIEKEGPVDVKLFAESPRTLDFSQFTPRGHYTQSAGLTNYFKAMIWLGRTELYLIAPVTSGPPPSQEDIQRQTIDAVLIAELATLSQADPILADIEDPLRSFVGDPDNVTLPNVHALIAESGLKSAAELLDIATWKRFQNTLATRGFAFQRINSQILMSDPMSPEKIVPASAFLLLGQRFVIDSYVTGEVVYDKLTYQGEKMMRMLPSTYDILFALGNNGAGQLLQPELNRYHYAPNLAALRYLVDSYDAGFWDGTLYNGWLNAIRALNPPADRKGLPAFMKTAAWWQQKMNTQLASWAQLRHDNLLYAKQSYTGGVGCSFPKSLVEPIPEFYDAVARFASGASEKISRMPFTDQNAAARIINYFNNLKETCGTLAAIARKELASAPLTTDEETFLKTMLFETPSGCTTAMVGWYPKLFYRGEDALKAEDMVVADVHTTPTDAAGAMVGWVMHGGTGPLNMAVVVCDMPDGKPVAFIGPVMSYYEHVSTNFKRLTDEEWKTAHMQAPSFRPPFVNLYLAGKEGEAKGETISLAVDEGSSSVPPAAPAPASAIGNFPNPFTASTVISFTIGPSESGRHAELAIFDETGGPVCTLVDENLPAGAFTARWDGTAGGGRVAAGTYLYRLRVGERVVTGTMKLER